MSDFDTFYFSDGGATINGGEEPPGDGNEVSEVIVTGLGKGYDGRYDNLFGAGGGGGGSGGSGGQTLGSQANDFATAKITTDLDMSDPNNRAWYEQMHEALAKLYMKAVLQPGAFIDGPGNMNMSGSQVLQSLQNLTVNLTSNYVQFGAYMQAAPGYGSGVINLGVPQLNGHRDQFGDPELGRNYVIFHELAHGSVAGLEYASIGGLNQEAFANSLGYSMAGFVGESYPAINSDIGSSGWLGL